MRIFLITGLVLTLAACSGGGSFGSGGSASGLNPFNWFGGGQRAARRNSLEPRRGYNSTPEYRQLADQITDLSVERSSVGTVITATALMPTQGWFNAELVRIEEANEDEVIFEFRVEAPLSAKAVGPARSREITAGGFLSVQDLAGRRTIRVIGARNNRSARR